MTAPAASDPAAEVADAEPIETALADDGTPAVVGDEAPRNRRGRRGGRRRRRPGAGVNAPGTDEAPDQTESDVKAPGADESRDQPGTAEPLDDHQEYRDDQPSFNDGAAAVDQTNRGDTESPVPVATPEPKRVGEDD